MRQALRRFPVSHAAGAQEAGQPAQGDARLPMQPALSLTAWTTEEPSGHIPGQQEVITVLLRIYTFSYLNFWRTGCSM